MHELIHEHWRILLAGYVVANMIETMPSPAETGPTSTALYKWIFACLHTLSAGIPRIIFTMFPQFAKFLPGNADAAAVAEDKKADQDAKKP